MTAKRKSSGRVTPKGTKNPTKTRSDADTGHARDERTQGPKVPVTKLRDQGHAARPVTHNRGNR